MSSKTPSSKIILHGQWGKMLGEQKDTVLGEGVRRGERRVTEQQVWDPEDNHTKLGGGAGFRSYGRGYGCTKGIKKGQGGLS